MKAVWKQVPDLKDAWLHLIVPSTIAIYATLFLFSMKHHVKRICDRNKERHLLPLSNHWWLLTYAITGIILPSVLYIFQHYYGEIKNDDWESDELGLTRRSLALLSFIAIVIALLSFLVNLFSIATGFRGMDQLSASRALSQVILPVTLFFILTHIPWLFYHDEDVIDICRMKALLDYDDDYYDDLAFTDKCTMRLDASVEWGLVLNSSVKLLFFCCFGGVYFRQYLCRACPCCFCFDCCSCCGCRSRVSQSVLSLSREDKHHHHYVVASQELDASNATYRMPPDKAFE